VKSNVGGATTCPVTVLLTAVTPTSVTMSVAPIWHVIGSLPVKAPKKVNVVVKAVLEAIKAKYHGRILEANLRF